jgi:hypothetical protein
MIEVNILRDSICESGNRLTTFVATYPRFILAEINTHRALTRNTASSRAIPSRKVRDAVWRTPVVPEFWGRNQPGMQATKELEGWRLWCAQKVWSASRLPNLMASLILDKLGVHKQIANRILEPHLYVTSIITATEYDNFFKLRAHPDAQPEIKAVAESMQMLYNSNAPEWLWDHEWHRPLVDKEDLSMLRLVSSSEAEAQRSLSLVSVARCARISYTNHDKKVPMSKDIELCNKLSSGGHWSPFEHIARPSGDNKFYRNFRGYKQLRTYMDQQ